MHTYDYKVSDRSLGNISDVKVYRPQEGVSGHAQTSPPGYRNLEEMSYRLRGSRTQKKHAWIRSLWTLNT